ncbi:hypothetical protein B4U80_13748 [Leptotrombidium deliense]|uniref:Fibronectin type-III domain-containing protein n=1 Tax=Leptotrombidium deliense TaxID=299467 RepID=A0A443SH02_9ACAR|nr:hypothetical protein B4U80_13748 [Leptotrombidium deliense]
MKATSDSRESRNLYVIFNTKRSSTPSNVSIEAIEKSFIVVQAVPPKEMLHLKSILKGVQYHLQYFNGDMQKVENIYVHSANNSVVFVNVTNINECKQYEIRIRSRLEAANGDGVSDWSEWSQTVKSEPNFGCTSRDSKQWKICATFSIDNLQAEKPERVNYVKNMI